jgi:hypothetical protein
VLDEPATEEKKSGRDAAEKCNVASVEESALPFGARA